MQKDTANTPGEPERRVPSDAEYEHAHRVVNRIRRAATEPAYRAALTQVYRDMGWADRIPLLHRAIAEYRRNTGEAVTA